MNVKSGGALGGGNSKPGGAPILRVIDVQDKANIVINNMILMV